MLSEISLRSVDGLDLFSGGKVSLYRHQSVELFFRLSLIGYLGYFNDESRHLRFCQTLGMEEFG